MLIADMIHSCSNAHVAEAAVSCIGGSFAERVCVMAGRSRMNAGRFVSIVVRDFARRANHETLVALNRKVAGADQPLLCGLVHVVEPALEDDALFFDDEDAAFAPEFLRGGAFYKCVARMQ